MNTKTLAGIGIGIGLSLVASMGVAAFSDDAGEPSRGRPQVMQREVQQLFAQMGVDADQMDPAEMMAMIQSMGYGAGQGQPQWNMGSTGYAGYQQPEFTAEDLMLLQAFSQMFAGSGYGDMGNMGYMGGTGYSGGSTGYGSDWSGGDNYYSSRVGTGNYNADNSAGYVYIPGTGSVSYGM